MIFQYEANEVFRFAEEQLKMYFSACVSQSDRYVFHLGKGEEFLAKWHLRADALRYDGFYLKRAGDDIVIGGNFERSVLFGVYELLERQGCVFVIGEGKAEIVPEARPLNLEGEVLCNPDYEIRSYVNSTDTPSEKWYRETAKIVDYCAKNKINTFFLHQNLDNDVDGYNREIFREVKKRGMIFEFGGHQAQNFLPRTMFEQHPELFSERDGRRTAAGNLCATNPQAQRILCEGVKKFLDRNPGIDILHFWFEDAVEGSWCSCERCRQLTPVQQQDLIVRTVAEFIKPYHKTRLDLLLYHDTITDIDRIREEKGCLGTFAPRERCYRHGIGDDSCANNRFYAEGLVNAVGIFGRNTEVFEYYSDVILFSKTKTVLPRVIAEDLEWYHAKGVDKICDLAFGKYSLDAYDINNYVFMRKAFDVDCDLNETLERFYAAIDYPDKNFLRRYYAELERASALYFAFCGYERCFTDIRKQAICDYFGEHIEKIGEAKTIVRNLCGQLEQRLVEGENAFLRSEADLLKISIMEIEQVELRMKARWKIARGSGRTEEILAEFDDTKRKLYQIIDLFNMSKEKYGVIADGVLIEHLCKDQIWTVNETIMQELHMDADLDRSKI